MSELRNIVENIKSTRVSNAVAAGSADENTSILNMEGFRGVSWEVMFGAITAGAVTGVKVQQGDESDLSDASDLEDSALAIADNEDNQALIIDVYRPLKQYVRLVITRATQNAVIDGAMAHQFYPRKVPVTQDATTIANSLLMAPSPGEGTA